MERLRAIERNFIFHLRTHCRALSLAVVVLPFVVLASIVAFSRLSTTPPYVGPDALVFEYSGWLIVNGRVPYLDLWDIKPPGIHYVAGGLAAVFGFSQGLFHTSSVIVTMSVSLSVIILVWQLVAQSTNDYIAAAIAGTATLAFKTTYVLPSVGLRPKFYVLLFGLLSVHFLVVKKHTRAVVFSRMCVLATRDRIFDNITRSCC